MATPISEIIASNLLDPSIAALLGDDLYSRALGKLLGNICDDPEVESKLSLIPSETTMAERRFLYNFFRHVWSGKGDVFEVGPFLGGTTRAIALGMLANSNKVGSSKLNTYDSWDYGTPDFIAKTLEPAFTSGHLNQAEKAEFLTNATQRKAFELLHRNQPYFPLISVEPFQLPQNTEELKTSPSLIKLDQNKQIDAFFVDGCKTWYSTKYFLEQASGCASVGSYFIFQDYGWYTCFWISSIMEVFQEYFTLVGFVDCTYTFRLTKPLSPEIVNNLCPDDPSGFGPEAYSQIFTSLGYKSGIRGDTKGMVVSKLHHAGALAYIGQKAEAKTLIEKISGEPWAINYQNEINRAIIQPTYGPNGMISLVEEKEEAPKKKIEIAPQISASKPIRRERDLSELCVFVPAQIRDAFFDVISNLGNSNGFTSRMSDTLQTLDAASLSCMTVRDNRSQRYSRTPFAFPFTSEATYFALPPSNMPITAVDWLFLGGDANTFIQMLLTCMLTHAIPKINVIPFERMRGIVSQEIQDDDYATYITRPWHSNNETTVAKHMQELLNLDPDDWNSMTAKVHLIDLWPQFAQQLAKTNFKPKSIVDLGCGLAHLTRSASRAFPEALVKGVDISPSTVKVINAKLGSQNLSFHLGSMEDLSVLKSKSQDLVISTYALNQSINQTRAAEEAFRVLSPGGQLMAIVVGDSYFSHWRFPETSITAPDTGFINEEWRKVAQANGYKLKVQQLEPDLHYLRVDVNEQDRAILGKLKDEVRNSLATNQPWGHNFQITAVPGEDDEKVSDNYIEQLENNILNLQDAPQTAQELTRRIWSRGVQQSQLAPQAVDFLVSCYPRAGSLIRNLMENRSTGSSLSLDGEAAKRPVDTGL